MEKFFEILNKAVAHEGDIPYIAPTPGLDEEQQEKLREIIEKVRKKEVNRQKNSKGWRKGFFS